MKCMIHGSFRKHFDLISETAKLFGQAGIEVIAPELSKIVGETNGFVHLESDESMDPRITELLYLKKISKLGPQGFSYYVNPEGTLGTSASYELGIDQLTNTRYLFMRKLEDHPAYVPQNSIWEPAALAEYILRNRCCPPPKIPQDETTIQQMLQSLILPGSLVAVGAIIVDYSSKRYKKGEEREVLLVQTHKWGDRFSIIGGKVQRNERLDQALHREVEEETGLRAKVEESICTFDKIKDSGYYIPDSHKIFTDNVVRVDRRTVQLNHEAEGYIWIPPSAALNELDIEPNARKTLEIYVQKHMRMV